MAWWLADVEATGRAGELLGACLHGPALITLDGTLGAGKTSLVQGLGRGLQVSTAVSSPTYALVAGHEGGRLPLWHADLYRLEHEDAVEQLGLDELLPGAVCAVEWAHKFPDALPAARICVRLDVHGEGRRLQVHAVGATHEAVAQVWAAALDQAFGETTP